MPSVSVVSVVVLAVVTEVGVGVGSVLMGNMIPSPANVEAESKRHKTDDAKSLFSFFMVFPD